MHPDYAQRSHLPAVLPTHTTHKSRFYGYILARVLSNNTQMAFAVAKIVTVTKTLTTAHRLCRKDGRSHHDFTCWFVKPEYPEY